MSTEDQTSKKDITETYKEIDEFISDKKTEEEIEEVEVPLESQVVKLNWLRVLTITLILTTIVVGITLIALLIVSRNKELIFLFSPHIFFLECGIFLTFGGCLGTFRQSFSISYLRHKFTKTDMITGADTKLAIASSYTYIFAGVLLGLASLLAWYFVK
ncbi:MAG: hypothetical protein FK733_14910 [Asgard group archaeon]|nr:hypothetical protein [Asgard group archaeon]